MYANITNHYHPGQKRPKLVTQQVTLQDPQEGAAFAHHPRIAVFKDRIYVVYTTGRVHEDDAGQHVRIVSCRTDDFEHWTQPQVLVEAADDPAFGMSSPAGLYANGDQMVLYYGQSRYREGVLVNGYRPQDIPAGGRVSCGAYYIVTADGTHWSDPAPMEGGFGANHSPQRLRSGRLLFSGSWAHPYTDEPTGLTGWVVNRAFPPGYPANEAFEDGEGLVTQTGLVRDDKVGLCEGSFVEAADGALYMFYRSGTPWLWAAKSVDDGETWSLPEPTRFSDNRTKFHLGRLPSGKYYYVGCPDPFPPRTRPVLALSLSDDGLDYRQHFIIDDTQYKGRFVGIDKNGIYGYPETVIHDGWMYIACSICKERMICIRFPVDTL